MRKPDYDRDLFVGRSDIIRKVKQWLRQPTNRRLMSILGSPGVGKSWILGKLQEELQNHHIILWPTADDWDGDSSLLVWINQQINTVNNSSLCHGNIHLYFEEETFQIKFDTLVGDLCNRCRLQEAPILFIDGFDEISEDKRIWVEDHLLQPFLGPDCTRVILSRRKKITLQKGYLRWRQEILEVNPFSTTEGKNQQEAVGIINETFPLELDGYVWQHPWLNYQLFEAFKHDQMISQNDMKIAIQNLISPNSISDEAFKLLVTLSTHEIEWTDRDVKSWVEDREDLDNYLPELMNCGIIQETHGAHRKVSDGVRELARAWQKQNGGELS